MCHFRILFCNSSKLVCDSFWHNCPVSIVTDASVFHVWVSSLLLCLFIFWWFALWWYWSDCLEMFEAVQLFAGCFVLGSHFLHLQFFLLSFISPPVLRITHSTISSWITVPKLRSFFVLTSYIFSMCRMFCWITGRLIIVESEFEVGQPCIYVAAVSDITVYAVTSV